MLGINMQKGGEINIAGGAIMIETYAYFSWYSRPRLLEWLNPTGTALSMPLTLSAAISIISDSKK